MTPSELQWLGVAETAKLFRSREVSPVEVVDAILEWIDRTENVVGGYSVLLGEQARKEARAAERALSSGDDRGPLHGITYSVKDVIAVKDVPMQCNSRIAEGFVPVEDSHVVRRMRQGGAICLGMAVTHELSWGNVSPPAKNPWNLSLVPGGSSGGSGALVAAGYCACSIGADCAGSIRIPASLNGVCGMRPTFGRVGTSGSVPISLTLDTIGPLARRVEDVALMLGTMAGHDPADPTSSDAPIPDFTSKIGHPLDGMVLGVPTNYFHDHLEDGVRSALKRAVDTLSNLGMVVREIQLPMVENAIGTLWTIILAESAATLDEYTFDRADDYGPDVRSYVELGNLILAKDYCRAQQMRTLIRQDFERAFRYDEVDVMAIPATPITAKPYPGFPSSPAPLIRYPDGFEEEFDKAYLRCVAPVPLSACPSLVVPCSLSDEDGLPVGIQLVAPHFKEDVAFQVGYALQEARGWDNTRPRQLVEMSKAERTEEA